MKKEVHIDLDEGQGVGTVAGSGTSQAVVDESGSKVLVVNEDGGDTDKLPASAIVNDDGSVTLPLIEPVTITHRKDGKEKSVVYSSLTFHRLKGADIQAIAAASKEKDTVVTFARSTRMPQFVMNVLFDELDAADIVDGGKVINHFLTSGRRTGR